MIENLSKRELAEWRNLHSIYCQATQAWSQEPKNRGLNALRIVAWENLCQFQKRMRIKHRVGV